jgi:hypothetical protein
MWVILRRKRGSGCPWRRSRSRPTPASLVLVGVAEHALASAEQDREHQQVVTVVQAGVGEVTGGGGAAVDDVRPALGLLERGDIVERAENGGLAPVVDQVVRRSGSSRRRTSASPCSRGAPSPCRWRSPQVQPDLAEHPATGPPEQHRRALVLLATLELVGLLDELDVLERGADRTPSAVGRQRR